MCCTIKYIIHSLFCNKLLMLKDMRLINIAHTPCVFNVTWKNENLRIYSSSLFTYCSHYLLNDNLSLKVEQ